MSDNIEKTDILGKVKNQNDADVNDSTSISSSFRVISYKRINGTVVAVRNQVYINQLLSKFEILINYLQEFWVFKAIHDHTNLLISELSVKFSETQNYYNVWNGKIETMIQNYKEMIEDGSKRLYEFSNWNESAATKQMHDGQGSNLVIGRLNKDVAKEHLYQQRNYMMRKAVFEADAQAKIDCGSKNLNELNNLYEEFKKKQNEEIERNLSNLNKKLTAAKEFEYSISGCPNLFEVVNSLDYSNLYQEVSFLIPNLETLHKLFLDMVFLKENMLMKERLIINNENIATTSIKLAEELAAAPFLEAELKDCEVELNDRKERLANMTARETVTHIQNCIVKIHDNTKLIQEEMRCLDVSHDFDISTTQKDVKIRGKIWLDKNIQNLTHVDPYNFRLSNQALALSAEVEIWQNYLLEIVNKLQQKDILRGQLEALYNNEKLIREEFVNAHTSEDGRFKFYHEKYEILVRNIKNIEGVFNPEGVFALIGSIFNHSSISLKPGCCSRSIAGYLNTEIAMTEFYELFFKFLVKSTNLRASSCYNNPIKKVHECDNLKVSQIGNLLINEKILGSLQNPDGGSQEVVAGDRRTENVYESLTSCLKEAVDIITIQKFIALEIDPKNYISKLVVYSEKTLNLAKNLKYESLAKKLEHLKKKVFS